MSTREDRDFKEEDIYWAIGEYALRFDGYCAAEVVPYDDDSRNRFIDDFRKYFYIPKDVLLVKTQLFMLQRYFGKWGGEQTPAYDRLYSLYYLLYLESYRHTPPSVFRRDSNYHDHLPKDADARTLENLAGAVRRHFAGEKSPTLSSIDYVFDKSFYVPISVFPNQKLLSRPEVILSLAINPVLATNLLLRHSYESIPDIKSELSTERRQDAIRLFGGELAAMLKDLKLFQDDIKNRLFMFILQAWLSRKQSCVDELSVEYVLLMFLYLHLYRIELPEYIGREPFCSQWENLPKSRKEDTAELFRKKLCLMREERIKKKYDSQ